MTNLVLDPASLAILFPKASIENLLKVRIIGQVLEYNPQNASLTIGKVPGMPSPQVVSLDGIEQDTLDQDLSLCISRCISSMKEGSLDPGSIISIVGFYDGKNVNVIDCSTAESTYLTLEAIQTLNAVSKAQNIS